jgi:putative heme-binding domain-containing protein
VLSLRVNDGESAPGRLDRGAELFRGKGKCTDCHRVQGAGSTAGPDLTDIGRLREPDWLRRAVIEPETAIYDSFAGYRWTIAIPDNYLLVDVTTKEGEHVIGSRLNEDAFSIQIRDREGRIRSYDKTEIRNMQKQWGKSPMPSYRDVFSKTDVDDLVAYLASLRGLQ